MQGTFDAVLHLMVVSDYVCPWCYIGLTRVDQLSEDYEVEVDWVPYQLRPETPADGIPFDHLRGRGRYTEDYLVYLSDVASDAGVVMRERKLIPNSLPSLEAAEWAREQGCFPVLHHAMFNAYFQEQADIGQTDVLQKIAGDCGLDAQDLVLALSTGRYRQRLEEKLEWSQVAGLGGVPYYMFQGVDRYTGEARKFAFTGAQDYDVFRSVAERLGARRRSGLSGR